MKLTLFLNKSCIDVPSNMTPKVPILREKLVMESAQVENLGGQQAALFVLSVPCSFLIPFPPAFTNKVSELILCWPFAEGGCCSHHSQATKVRFFFKKRLWILKFIQLAFRTMATWPRKSQFRRKKLVMESAQVETLEGQ